jgi:hypothetical protein
VSSLGAYVSDESNKGGAYFLFKYAPDEIRNVMFLPLMKKFSWGLMGQTPKLVSP